MNGAVHIIIVTHNSEEVVPLCLKHIQFQSKKVTTCTVVDSGSQQLEYLHKLRKQYPCFHLIEAGNIGYGAANNLGYASLKLGPSDVVIFLNPDAYMGDDCIDKALAVLRDNPKAGVVSGKLLGYDIKKEKATGLIDSTGIIRSFYGRWKDRGQGEEDQGQYNCTEAVPAICGALMVCRAEALQEFGSSIFDEDFFLYKEDIELSLRLNRAGWVLLYDPQIVAYHCRGWQNTRQGVDYGLRLLSAENEVKLYKKHPSVYMVWAVIKYILVRYLRV